MTWHQPKFEAEQGDLQGILLEKFDYRCIIEENSKTKIILILLIICRTELKIAQNQQYKCLDSHFALTL